MEFGTRKYCNYFLWVLVLNTVGCYCQEISNRKRIIRSSPNAYEIDDFIYNLNYDPNQVLVYKGESVSSFRKREGHVDHSNNFIEITRERKSINNGKADIGVLISNEQRTFPGVLLVANSRLIDNTPDIVVFHRAPIKYTINLPGITSLGSFTVVPDFGNYKSALNDAINNWFNQYSSNYDVNAIFQSDHEFAHSKEQLRVKFGMDLKNTDLEMGIDFDAVDRNEKLIMIHKFKQIFYTVTVESPSNPSGLFAPDVTRQQLERKINDRNPPLLVDSVSYGRVIYVKMETSSTDKEAKAILSTKITKFNTGVNSEMEYAKRLENLNMQVYVMGGSNKHIDLIEAKTLEDINKVIVNFSKFTRDNQAYPISFSTEFIKDNSRAMVISNTEYTETKRTEHKKGLIKLSHTGWYVAQFKVEWDEVNFDSNGNEVVSRKGWYKNLQDLTAPFSTEIELSGNCRNIAVFAKECTGLFWEWWRTVIDRSGIDLVSERTFSIWGTTLNPKYSIEP